MHVREEKSILSLRIRQKRKYPYTRVRGEKRAENRLNDALKKDPYTRVLGEKRCTVHFDSFHAGYPYAYE